jgi:hypothetical protein
MKRHLLASVFCLASFGATATPLVTLDTVASPISSTSTYQVPNGTFATNNFAGALLNFFGPTGLDNWLAGHSLVVNGLTPGLTATVTFDYFGSEAGGQNWLTWNGADAVRNQDYPVQSVGALVSSFGTPFTSVSYSITGAESILPFGFRTLTTGNMMGSVTNANNLFITPTITGDALKMNFIYKAIDASSGWIMLDDDGNIVSDNHDDMVFRVTVTVPNPGVIALLGIGAVGLMASRRRQKA